MSSKDLPVEVLVHAFKHLTYNELDSNALSSCMLVSKKWKYPAQTILYKHLELTKLSTVKSLFSTVESNQQIVGLIKSIKISFITKEKETHHVGKLFSSLPFLEAISLQSPIYCQLLLDILLDSKLPRLKSISTEKLGPNLNDFITCVLLLRKQLETIHISSIFRPGNFKLEIIQLRRIYSRLHQFERLSELSICKATKNDTDFMESVLKSCPSVKNIGFSFAYYVNMVEIEKHIVNAECIPKDHIKQLECRGDVLNIQKHLSYVMHKFPQLNSLLLELNTHSPRKMVDAVFLSQLVDYLSKIRNIKVKSLIAKAEDISETVPHLWRSFTPSKTNLSIVYSQSGIAVGAARADLFKSNKCTTDIWYSSQSTELDCIKIIERYGGLIGNLKISGLQGFTIESNKLTRDTILEQFVVYVFKHCTNIEKFCIQSCTLMKINYYEGNLNKRIILENFSMIENDIYHGVFRSLSNCVAEIKKSNLLLNRYQDSSSDEFVTNITVDMPYTKLGFLNLSCSLNPRQGTRYLFLKLSTKYEDDYFSKCDSYKINEQGYVGDLSNEQEYQDNKYSQNTHIHVICESIGTLEIHQGLSLLVVESD